MSNCQHDFIKVSHKLTFATVVCAFCGQVRHVHESGTINIIKKEGHIHDMTNERPE